MYKALDKWLLPWIAALRQRPHDAPGTPHVFLAVCDHYEPLSPFGRQPFQVGLRRVERWRTEYPARFGGFRDADGRRPQHSFFFPEEEFAPDFIDPLRELCAAGFGEVEIHLHHDRDTADALRDKLRRFIDILHGRFGFLGRDAGGRPRYAFIHGNWALCNPFPDGRHCGVDTEVSVLSETGCYADFTFPSAPSPTQPRIVNAIYCIRDKSAAGAARACDRGRRMRVGSPLPAGSGLLPHPDLRGRVTVSGDPQEAEGPPELLLIQGPIALNWRWRKWGVLPRIEHGDLCATNPPTLLRFSLWLRQWVHVQGRPDHVFIKVHCHGCREENADVLLGESTQRFHEGLGRLQEEGTIVLHYVTAREMANIVLADVVGASGDLRDLRNLFVAPPPVRNPERREP